MSSQLFRAKFTHRPNYSGFVVCTLHAVRLRQSSIVEIEEVSPASLLPIPKYKLDAGHVHCDTCNRERGSVTASTDRVSVG